MNRVTILTVLTLLTATAAMDREASSYRWALSAQYMGLTIHPKGGSLPERFPRKLDSSGYFVFELGAALNADYAILPGILFVRTTAAHYRDCADMPAGFFHCGVRGVMVHRGRHSINGGLGLTLVYRKDWHQFEEYREESFYRNNVHKGWQYRFLPYGGEFEYLYSLSDRLQLQYTVIPGIPFVITSRFGIRALF